MITLDDFENKTKNMSDDEFRIFCLDILSDIFENLKLICNQIDALRDDIRNLFVANIPIRIQEEIDKLAQETKEMKTFNVLETLKNRINRTLNQPATFDNNQIRDLINITINKLSNLNDFHSDLEKLRGKYDKIEHALSGNKKSKPKRRKIINYNQDGYTEETKEKVRIIPSVITILILGGLVVGGTMLAKDKIANLFNSLISTNDNSKVATSSITPSPSPKASPSSEPSAMIVLSPPASDSPSASPTVTAPATASPTPVVTTPANVINYGFSDATDYAQTLTRAEIIYPLIDQSDIQITKDELVDILAYRNAGVTFNEYNVTEIERLNTLFENINNKALAELINAVKNGKANPNIKYVPFHLFVCDNSLAKPVLAQNDEYMMEMMENPKSNTTAGINTLGREVSLMTHTLQVGGYKIGIHDFTNLGDKDTIYTQLFMMNRLLAQDLGSDTKYFYDDAKYSVNSINWIIVNNGDLANSDFFISRSKMVSQYFANRAIHLYR